MWASAFNITVDPAKTATEISTDFLYPPGTYNLVDKGCNDEKGWSTVRGRCERLGVSCTQFAEGWDALFTSKGATKMASWGQDDDSIIHHLRDNLLSKNVSGALALDECGELPDSLPPAIPGKPTTNRTGKEIMQLAASAYRQVKRAKPSTFLSVWNCGAQSIFSELMLDGTIDLALIEGYTFCGERVGKCATWASNITDYYPRLHYARQHGWLNRSIFFFGYIVGRSELNPGAFTKGSLGQQMRALKRDWPEMPGVGFYHPHPGNLSWHPGGKHPKPDPAAATDNATFELIRFASQLAKQLYPPPK